MDGTSTGFGDGNTWAKRRKKRLFQKIFGLNFIIFAVVAVFIGRGGHGFNMKMPLPLDHVVGNIDRVVGNHTQLKGVIGSEKAAFFQDPEVVAALAQEGISVEFSTAGSMEMVFSLAPGTDFAFPSSQTSAQTIVEARPEGEAVELFSSPLIAVTHRSLIPALTQAQLVNCTNPQCVLDVDKMAQANKAGTRWRDINRAFKSPRVIGIESSDIATSNSAQQYVAVAAAAANGGKQITTENELQRVLPNIRPLFAGQTHPEASSAQPFARFSSVTAGEMPMVLAYEQQLLEREKAGENNADFVPLYLTPNISSEHTLVALNDKAKTLIAALQKPQLQKLAVKHGFRTKDKSLFDSEFGSHAPQLPAQVRFIAPPATALLGKLVAEITK